MDMLVATDFFFSTHERSLFVWTDFEKEMAGGRKGVQKAKRGAVRSETRTDHIANPLKRGIRFCEL
jgi:hypothetical protein